MLSSGLKKQATVKEAVLMVIMSLAVCYLIYSYFYQPKKTAVIKLSEQVTKINEEISREKQIIQEMKSKQVKSDEDTGRQLKSTMAISPVVQMIQRTRAPAFGNISELFLAISKPDFRSSLQFESLKHTEEKVEDGFKSTEFHLVVRGQFVRIVTFLEKIEDIEALISLESMKMNSNESNDQVTLDVTGTFFQMMEDDNV